MEIVTSIEFFLLIVTCSGTVQSHVTLDWNNPEAVDMDEYQDEPVNDEFGLLLISDLCP